MNIFLWVLQGLLAAHTIMGAIWKFSNSEQAVPTLKAIPHGVWMALSGVEILCSVALVLPLLVASAPSLPPIAALCIAGEMLIFSGIHLASGATNHGPMAYWLVVAAVCGFIAYGRFVMSPL